MSSHFHAPDRQSGQAGEPPSNSPEAPSVLVDEEEVTLVYSNPLSPPHVPPPVPSQGEARSLRHQSVPLFVAPAGTRTSAGRRSSGGSSGGRKQYYVKQKCFDKITEDGEVVGSSCKGCGKEIRDKQRRSLNMGKHILQCPVYTQVVKDRVLSESSALQKERGLYHSNIEISSKRKGSFSAESPTGKKRRMEESPERAKALTSALLEVFVEQAWSFTALDTTAARPNAFMRFLQMALPWYARDYFPTRFLMTGRKLNELYDSVLDRVCQRISSALATGFGTIIFDGWGDATSAPVVNVLLRTEATGLRFGRRTFFLESVYTSHERVGASGYIRILESVLQKFGGMDRICAVTSDSAQCCVNARNALTERYPKLVGVQDQAHVANLAMQDIGRLPWVKEILDTVAWVTAETRVKIKLRARIKEAIEKFNNIVGSQVNTQAQAPLDTGEAPVGGDDDIRGLHGSPLFPPLPLKAVMLRKPAKTRFASIESTLEAYLRSRGVLLEVVQAPDFFSNLWPALRTTERGKRAKFISAIESREFLDKVKDVHRVFRLLRRYLRVFDSDDAKISDVVPKTIAVGLELERVPLTAFFTSERKNQVIGKFSRRQNGPLDASIKVRLLEDIHFAAHLVDPHRCPRDVSPFLYRFRSYLMRYCAGAVELADETSDGEDSRSRALRSQDLRGIILEQYMRISGEWNDEKDDAGNDEVFKEFRKMPLVYWKSLAFRHEFEELREFAMRTLSVSPSSCAAERSFSMQGRIRTKARNRLDTEKVKKLAFSHWNMKLLGDAQLQQADFWRSVQESDGESEDSDDTEDEQQWDTESGAASRSVFEDEDDPDSDQIGLRERNVHAKMTNPSIINSLESSSGTRQ